MMQIAQPIVMVLAGLLGATPTLSAAVFTVLNSNPEGPGSLAQAIQDANASEEEDRIIFSIPGAGVHKIDVSAKPLPMVQSSITIDGYTQPGAKPNTRQVGNDAVILIQIDGGGVLSRSTIGLNLRSNCTIRGLCLTGFANPSSGAAIAIDPGDTLIAVGGNRLEGNFIGVAPDGISLSGNSVGVRLRLTGGNTVGGGPLGSSESVDPATRNVIAGNDTGILWNMPPVTFWQATTSDGIRAGLNRALETGSESRCGTGLTRQSEVQRAVPET